MAVDIGAIAPPKKAEIKTRTVKQVQQRLTRKWSPAYKSKAGKFIHYHGRPAIYFAAGVLAPATYLWSSNIGFQVTTDNQVAAQTDIDIGQFAVGLAGLSGLAFLDWAGKEAGLWYSPKSLIFDWIDNVRDNTRALGKAIFRDEGHIDDIILPGAFFLGVLPILSAATGRIIQSEAEARRAA